VNVASALRRFDDACSNDLTFTVPVVYTACSSEQNIIDDASMTASKQRGVIRRRWGVFLMIAYQYLNHIPVLCTQQWSTNIGVYINKSQHKDTKQGKRVHDLMMGLDLVYAAPELHWFKLEIIVGDVQERTAGFRNNPLKVLFISSFVG